MVVNKWRRFKVRQDLAEVTHRAVQFIFMKVLLQLVPVGQHGRRQNRCIRPKGVGVSWIGWPSHYKADVVSGTTEHCGNAFAADALQPVFIDLQSHEVIVN